MHRGAVGKAPENTLASIRAAIADASDWLEIDVGSWFDPRFSGERVPTLVEVLEAARGKAHVVIELKYYGHDQQPMNRHWHAR